MNRNGWQGAPIRARRRDSSKKWRAPSDVPSPSDTTSATLQKSKLEVALRNVILAPQLRASGEMADTPDLGFHF